MAGKFSRKKQEPDASWVLGAVLIALLLAAITLGALWVLRTSRTVGASNAAASQVPAKTDAPQESAMQQPQAPEPQPEPEALPSTGQQNCRMADMTSRRFTRPSRRSFLNMTLPASIRRRFW